MARLDGRGGGLRRGDRELRCRFLLRPLRLGRLRRLDAFSFDFEPPTAKGILV